VLADVLGSGAQGASERADRQVVEASDRVPEDVASGAGAKPKTANECAECVRAADAAESEGRRRGDLRVGVTEQRYQRRDGPRIGELGQNERHLDAHRGVFVREVLCDQRNAVGAMLDDGPREDALDTGIGLGSEVLHEQGQRCCGRGVKGRAEANGRLAVAQAFGQRDQCQDLFPADLGGALEVAKAPEQLLLGGEPMLDRRDVACQRFRSVEPRIVEGGLDLGKAQPERLQVLDGQEPAEVVRRVEAVVAVRALARHEEPELVVMAKRPHGQPGPPGHLTDLEPHLRHDHTVSGHQESGRDEGPVGRCHVRSLGVTQGVSRNS